MKKIQISSAVNSTSNNIFYYVFHYRSLMALNSEGFANAEMWPLIVCSRAANLSTNMRLYHSFSPAADASKDIRFGKREKNWRWRETVLIFLAVAAAVPLYSSLQSSKGDYALLEISAEANVEAQDKGFVPYPYNTLGSGSDMECEWETRSTNNSSHYDFTQRSALAEGVCIPPKLNASFHIFSSAEAIHCLSPTKLIISGDSYMKQLFIGLADILLSSHLNEDKEIRDKVQRAKMVLEAQRLLNNRHNYDPSFPRVIYTCEEECYGNDEKFSTACSRCVNEFTNKDENTVGVVGAGIHILNRHKAYTNKTVDPTWNKAVGATVKDIRNFLGKVDRTIYVSIPSYQLDKIPEPYRDSNDIMSYVYFELLPNVAPQNPQQPFLDVFQLTRSCVMDNCTFDGGHRSRYVNRWKAQMLLNTLCKM